MKIIENFIHSNDWFINVLFGFGVLLILYFLIFYLLNSFLINRLLKKAVKEIKKVGELQESEKRQTFANIFNNTKLELIWAEYSETLHDQVDNSGAEVVVRKVRSTMPSQVYFNQQIIIETPLAVEFFKHLPGILTGLGIIGTFYGLINGLTSFDTTDPQKINESLTLLLNSVRHAFIFSAAAICAAIVVTFLEKILLERCIYNLDKLNLKIDRHFDGGVGEEYLSDLVKHSQESSAQTRLLKDSLVNDLKAMLANMLEEQSKQSLQLTQNLSASYKEASEHAANRISESVEVSLKGPLEDIAKAVNTATGEQSNHVEGLLQNVLMAFMEKLDSTFGRQFDGLHEMIGQSVSAINSMQDGFGVLIQEMKDASSSSASIVQEKLSSVIEEMNNGQIEMQKIMANMLENMQTKASDMNALSEASNAKMAGKLKELFDESEMRQKQLSEQMQTFIDEMKQNMLDGQQESMEKVLGSMTQIDVKFGQIFESFKNSRQQIDEESRVAQKVLHEKSTSVLDGIGNQVSVLLENLEKERKDSSALVERIAEISKDTLNKLIEASNKVGSAADKFSVAIDNLSDVNDEIEEVMKTVGKSNNDISNGLTQLSKIIDDYKSIRDSVLRSLETIQAVVASSQSDAASRKQIVDDLKSISMEMKKNNQEAVIFLNGVGDVLSRSFDSFGDGVSKSLTKVTGSLDNNLSQVVNRISSGFDDLAENVEELTDAFEKSINKTK